MKRPSRQDPPTPTRILDAATPLFYQRSLASVTLDEVAEAAGMTKRTLYYHYASKDELVLAYLARWRDRTRRTFVDDELASGAEALLTAFRRLEKEVVRPGYRGCPFVNAVAEINDRAHPVTALALTYKEERRAWFEALLRRDGIAGAARLSEQVMALWEGAMVRALVVGAPKPVRMAREAVATLLRASAQTRS